MTYMYTQKFDGHVTILPRPSLRDYTLLAIDLEKNDLIKAAQQTYIETLRKISLIRALYGVEREFDRYHSRLLVKSNMGNVDAALTDDSSFG